MKERVKECIFALADSNTVVHLDGSIEIFNNISVNESTVLVVMDK